MRQDGVEGASTINTGNRVAAQRASQTRGALANHSVARKRYDVVIRGTGGVAVTEIERGELHNGQTKIQ
jgi:hypothetical protein